MKDYTIKVKCDPVVLTPETELYDSRKRKAKVELKNIGNRVPKGGTAVGWFGHESGYETYTVKNLNEIEFLIDSHLEFENIVGIDVTFEETKHSLWFPWNRVVSHGSKIFLSPGMLSASIEKLSVNVIDVIQDEFGLTITEAARKLNRKAGK